MGFAYRNLTLIGSGFVIAGQMDNDGHFLETLFEVWVHLVPRNMSNKTAGVMKNK